ncbi:type III secretion system inner membrane ring lipoprotein SctJ [Pseudoduganella namucuonensis]|uniref:Lipoprotein n=1 Tax=Pseudoduganella namucuonensis TaxID=1035707 RepID=A0A1I7LW75_9BURK|nr:type III secretion inner membrane ring lipoprotein SctJ [Pseudoduganella namucuonensis]SFV13951.1 type III secretion protein J [Pseudoduganella namucuonensis]
MNTTQTMRRLLLYAGMLCVIGLLSACSKVVTLQSNLSDTDANEIVMVLNQQGIVVEKKPGKEGVGLMLAETDLARATSIMNGAGLPRRGRESLGEVFKKQGMISTPLEERVRYLHGLSEELGYTLQQFDNVISARVHVVLPERVAPGEPIQPSSAAVFIKYRPPIDEDAITPRVQRLVASSIPGLASEDGRAKVSVVLTPGEAALPGVKWTTIGPFKVDVDSARGLLATLIALGVVGALGLAAGGYTLVKGRGKLGKPGKGKADAGAAEAAGAKAAKAAA